jgi:aspartate/methionine/tyrosine aminotransferase
MATLYDDNISASNIVLFPGAQTDVTLSAQALLHKGDHAIVITPSYQSLEKSPKLAGCEISRVSLSPDTNWQLDITDVEATIQKILDISPSLIRTNPPAHYSTMKPNSRSSA